MIRAGDAWAGAEQILDESACPICGSEMCEGHDDDVREARQPVPAPVRIEPEALAFQPAAELMTQPRPVEVIEGGIASADRVSVLVSESGAGKTFVLLSMAAAVSDGVAWHGRSARPGSVAYLSFEGDALGLRLRALRDVAGHRLEHVYLLRASDPLSPIVDRDRIELPSRGELAAIHALDALRAELAASGRPPIVLLFIDTVRASLSGSEDSSESVSAYLRVVRRLLRHVPGAAAVLAHHAGWQDGESKRQRERGSSAWRGNCDATLYLEAADDDAERGEARLTLRALKVRDAERPAPLRLIRRRVELAEMDARGEPVTSCVIERDRRTREDREADEARTAEAAHRQTDLAVLRAMRDYPAATGISRLRPYLRLRTEIVTDAVARILRAGWAVEGRRGQPYTLTDVGIEQLSEPTP